MEKQKLKSVEVQLINGFVPKELQYGDSNCMNININMLQYNSIYQTYDYFENKYPSGFIDTFGLQSLVHESVEKSKKTSPLEELNKLLFFEEINKINNILEQQ